ncbi:MAG TPA: chorismate mutase, partial [Trueperaceae bacterium]|nr:chorismate mutase [Trueperaceae bacterium]
MQEKIQSLRARIDALNLKILELVSERGAVAAEIGALQSAM